MTWEVKLVKIINLPPLKLCESRVMVSYLPPGVHRQYEASWNRSPAHCVAASKSACNTLLFRSDSTLQSLCRRGNSSPEGKTNHKWACLTWSLTARVTCCLLVQLWPSRWFQWASAKVAWHISVLVTDFNTLTLPYLLMLVRRGSSLNRTGLTRVYITCILRLIYFWGLRPASVVFAHVKCLSDIAVLQGEYLGFYQKINQSCLDAQHPPTSKPQPIQLLLSSLMLPWPILHLPSTSFTSHTTYAQ